MRHQDGDIAWEVKEIVIDGQTVIELHFEKMKVGDFAGQYHPMFYWMPMIFLSNFIEPHYKLWQAYLGDEVIGSNLILVDGRVVSYEQRREIVQDFANAD